jgi:hypothetical protein
VNGRAFDAQVVLSPPESKLGMLLQQYVCARVTRMDGIDIGLFDFDRHNALYYFVINADEQILLRYGGRDAESATTYLNLRSLELALEEGLRMHESKVPLEGTRPQPLFPSDIPLLKKRTAWRGECVECHLIADYQNLHREQDGTLDRIRDMYRSPDIKTIGIHLDVPRGLVVKESSGAVADAGLQAGDRIMYLNGIRVRTFGDLQFHYDKVSRDAREIRLGIEREATARELVVKLPDRWWLTDLEFRHWTVEPLVFFKTAPLGAKQKAELGLPIDGFAGEVIETERFHSFANPALKRGDIVFGVQGIQRDDIANTPELQIKLRHRAGSTLELQVLRDGERFESVLTTERQNFRKVEP